MTKITLWAAQQKTYDGIVKRLNEGYTKIVGVLPTGGGKSVVIGYLGNKLKGRTLILTHRTEILQQNSEWLNNVGTLTSKVCDVSYKNKVVIAMVQTLHARLNKYGINYMGKFDNIILDETHIQIFEKVVNRYKPKRLIGFTATPLVNKKDIVEIEGIEYIKEYTLADFYQVMVVGATVHDLILDGKLVEDRNVELKLPNFDELQDSNSNPDGYTSQSLTNVYSNTASLNILKEAYEKYCVGKKTLLFNATTKVNLVVEKIFSDLGVDVRTFDSVNSKENERAEVIDWFNNTRNCMLIGTNVFTTGFNVPDVEVVIVNRATKSLSLWIQMVGRGSRITDKIFKDHFRCIDLGQNIYNHGIWSKQRDWQQYFRVIPLKPKNKLDLISIWECAWCGAYNTVGELECSECGKEKTVRAPIKKPDKDGVLIEVAHTVLPKADMIIKYAKAHGASTTTAFKILDKKILDLFIDSGITKDYYISRRSGWHQTIKKIYQPIFFAIVNDNVLYGKRKKLVNRLNELYEKVDKHYGM